MIERSRSPVNDAAKAAPVAGVRNLNGPASHKPDASTFLQKYTPTLSASYTAPTTALIATTLTISSTLQPRERSNAGFFKP